MSQKEQILAELAPLFAEAKEKGLWFQGKVFGHSELRFSSKELREYHDKGKYIWGAVNWKLVDPKEILSSLSEDIYQAECAYRDFLERIEACID